MSFESKPPVPLPVWAFGVPPEDCQATSRTSAIFATGGRWRPGLPLVEYLPEES